MLSEAQDSSKELKLSTNSTFNVLNALVQRITDKSAANQQQRRAFGSGSVIYITKMEDAQLRALHKSETQYTAGNLTAYLFYNFLNKSNTQR